jgi:UDP-N-acetyl-D-glucosamine dehydrogenase
MPTRFIELAGEINESMPRYVVGKLQRLLNGRGRCLNGAKIFVLGVTYKADVADPRETPARKVFELLQAEGARLSYADPYAAVFEAAGRRYESVAVTPKVLQHSDAVLILTGHSAFDYDLVVTESALVFDTRNATQRARAVRPSDRVVLL